MIQNQGEMKLQHNHIKNKTMNFKKTLLEELDLQDIPDEKKKELLEKTAEEILNQIGKRKIDYFIAGIGTGGTITGISKKLKEHFPSLKTIGIQPKKGDIIEGLRSLKDGYTPPIINLDLIDEIIDISEEDSLQGRNYLAKKGILVGPSSGAVFKAIKNLNLKGTVVTIFPDRGERYLK
jgi:cysteine synthase